MEDTAKYLIRADVTADGVVERSDVVGAIFGQTEGLLGQGLDLRDLQESSKVGRIDVDVRSENGQSFGEIVIASGLDRVETAILAAGLETIDRVGPCRSTVAVERIEDVRAAKRREVVERATDLLGEFDANVMSSDELVETVRRHAEVGDVTEYEDLPAGPRVADSDAVIVVEGRADVLTLLRYGVKNAIAVEGTNVPEAVADLTRERTVTAFPDGDRGGDLILKELVQVGAIDYVATAPEGRSVEDLDRRGALTALREKEPYDPEDAGATDEGTIDDATAGEAAAGSEATTDTEEAVTATDGSTRPAPDASESATGPDAEPNAPRSAEPSQSAPEDGTDAEAPPETLHGHVRAVIGGETDRARLLDHEFATLDEAPAEEAFDAVAEADPVPAVVVLDDDLTQRVLDIAAQRGVEGIVARAEGEFVKRPTAVRVRTAEQLLGTDANADADTDTNTDTDTSADAETDSASNSSSESGST